MCSFELFEIHSVPAINYGKIYVLRVLVGKGKIGSGGKPPKEMCASRVFFFRALHDIFYVSNTDIITYFLHPSL